MFQNLQERLESAFKNIKGQARINDLNIANTIKDIRRALIDADVNFKIAKEFTDKVKEKAVGTNNSPHWISTSTVTQAESLQPLAFVTVTQYCVVTVGVAIGEAQVVQLNPVEGDQLYVPPPVAVKVVFVPSVIIVTPEIVAVGVGFTVTKREAVSVHPVPTITV